MYWQEEINMMFEMITGTLYIAILISWLVGKLVVREQP
jgi:hypothetical protein